MKPIACLVLALAACGGAPAPKRPAIAPIISGELAVETVAASGAESSLRGIVRGPDQKPFPDVWVTVNATTNRVASANTNVQGEFTIENLAPGKYTIEFTQRDVLHRADVTIGAASTVKTTLANFGYTLTAEECDALIDHRIAQMTVPEMRKSWEDQRAGLRQQCTSAYGPTRRQHACMMATRELGPQWRACQSPWESYYEPGNFRDAEGDD